MVITSLTRNQVVRKGSWVRIPPSPPRELNAEGSHAARLQLFLFSAGLRHSLWHVLRDLLWFSLCAPIQCASFCAFCFSVFLLFTYLYFRCLSGFPAGTRASTVKESLPMIHPQAISPIVFFLNGNGNRNTETLLNYSPCFSSVSRRLCTRSARSPTNFSA